MDWITAGVGIATSSLCVIVERRMARNRDNEIRMANVEKEQNIQSVYLEEARRDIEKLETKVSRLESHHGKRFP